MHQCAERQYSHTQCSVPTVPVRAAAECRCQQEWLQRYNRVQMAARAHLSCQEAIAKLHVRTQLSASSEWSKRRVSRSTPLLDAVWCDAMRLAPHAALRIQPQSCTRRAGAHGWAQQHAALRMGRRYDRTRGTPHSAPEHQAPQRFGPVPQGALSEAYLALALPAESARPCAPLRASAKLRETLGAARTIGLLQPRTIRAPMLAFSGLPQAHVMHTCTCSAHSRHPPAPSRTHPARTAMRCCSERRRRPSCRPVRPAARGTHDARRARAWSSARWCRVGGTCGRGSGRARRSSGEALRVSSADAVRTHAIQPHAVHSTRARDGGRPRPRPFSARLNVVDIAAVRSLR